MQDSWHAGRVAVTNDVVQVHAAQLSDAALRDLGWRWVAGRDVVLKVQHDDMCCLMDSDVRNLGRLAAFVRGSMPFDAGPVSSHRSAYSAHVVQHAQTACRYVLPGSLCLRQHAVCCRPSEL